MKARFRGHWWHFRRRDSKILDGECQMNDAPREMWIAKRIRGLRLLEALVHESLHACFPDLTEDAVEEAGRDIAAHLWRLGWRVEKPHK